ncbi:MAG: C-GCAxxG-C-C family protein [Candidatus Eisenbacteria bacterium]|nr:C-GCAxxG-C-C family protein [Candidatus Eisenbacteria bacterium]
MVREDYTDGGRNDIAAKAVSLFMDTDFNCAESVLLAAAECLTKRTPSIPCVATAFGGGMGRKGSVCGALTGALMALGQIYGRSEPKDDKEKIYALTCELYDGFSKKFGSPFCAELLECDLGTAEGMDKYHKLALRRFKCKNYVAFCGETLTRMLKPAAPKPKTS